MIVGTVLKISSTIVVDGGGSVSAASVVIYDPSGTEITPTESSGVREMDESSSNPGTWEYIYQSLDDDDEGLYQYVVTATSGTYDAKAWGSFNLDAKPEI